MIETPPIPHRCRRANRCPDREKLEDRIYGAPIPTIDGLCLTCQRHLACTLQDLVVDYVELDLVLGCGSSAAGQFVSGTRELPIPIRTAVEAMQRKIVDTSECWAESVAQILRVDWDTQLASLMRPGVRLQRAANLLHNSVPVFLALRDVTHLVWDDYGHLNAVDRDGLDGAIQVLDLHHHARATLGRTRKVNRLPEACPECEREALEHPDGADIVTCAACKHWWTWDEYKDLQHVGDSGLAVAA